jgi:hypothetical protein
MPPPRPEPEPVERVGRVREALPRVHSDGYNPRHNEIRRLVKGCTVDELAFVLNLTAGEIRRRVAR